MSIYKTVKGHGKDVVLIHGWCCNHQHVQPIADELVKNFRVTSVDLPGSGDSDWNSNIKTIHDVADQLLDVLPKQAIYVGWSFGGLVSLSIAARYPERVARFVGIGTTPKFIADADNTWPAIPLPGFQAIFEQELGKQGFKAFFQSYYNNEFRDFNPKPENYSKLMSLLDEADKFDMDVLFQGIKICDVTDLRKEFSSLQCPIDLILGDQDTSVPVAIHKYIAALNPLVKIHLLIGAQHMPFWTHPEKFTAILHAILASDM